MARGGRPVARESVRYVWLPEGQVRMLDAARGGISKEERVARRLLRHRRRRAAVSSGAVRSWARQ